MQTKELKIYKESGRNYTPVPQIIIQGKWLRPLGFFVGNKVPSGSGDHHLTMRQGRYNAADCREAE